MKDRAGVVGKHGLNPLLRGICAPLARTLRIHLVGHSFGGRLVTAAGRRAAGDSRSGSTR